MRSRFQIAAATWLIATAVHAENFGVIGPTYEVREPHLLEQIYRQLEEKQRSGEIDRLQNQATQRTKQAFLNPTPISGLARVAMPRTRYFDPTYTLDRNIVDHSGAILFPAGTRKNPLEIVSLSQHLLFFDARDASQVAMAKRLIDHYEGRVKPILVAGSFAELMLSWKRPVFYDQGGFLVGRLGIRAVPSLVSQEGLRLRIDELEIAQ